MELLKIHLVPECHAQYLGTPRRQDVAYAVIDGHLIELPHADFHRCDTLCLDNYCGSHRSQCVAYKMDCCSRVIDAE